MHDAAVHGRMTVARLKQTCCVWGPGPKLQGDQGHPLHAQPWAATQTEPAAAEQDALCALRTQQLLQKCTQQLFEKS